MSNVITLYFQTTSLTDFIADLVAAGLVTIPPAAPEGMPPSAPYIPAAGVTVDYIGPMVQTPAVLDMSDPLHPVEITPATYYPGERANLYLSWHADFSAEYLLALQREAALRAATFAHGSTVLSPDPAHPKRVLG